MANKDDREETLEGMKGGKSFDGYKASGENGPTGSRRDYGKSGKEMGSFPNKTAEWNPQKGKASTYAICGVDCG